MDSLERVVVACQNRLRDAVVAARARIDVSCSGGVAHERAFHDLMFVMRRGVVGSRLTR